MSKQRELTDEIREWLSKNGYPLEMRTGAAIRAAGFQVVQSEYYLDPDSGVPREIDVVGSVTIDASKSMFRVTLVIECKESPAKPWVVFSADHLGLAPPARVAQRVATSLGHEFLMAVCQEQAAQSSDLFTLRGALAYGATQALGSGSDVAYTALTSAAKAAHARSRANSRHEDLCEILLPTIVISGRLFSASLGSDQALAVQEIDAASLLWRNPLVHHPFTIITVLTESALSHYARSISRAAAGLLQDLPSKVLEAENRLRGRKSKTRRVQSRIAAEDAEHAE